MKYQLLKTPPLMRFIGVTIPNRFEDNNSNVQDQSLVQALVLGQDIGLWSGNRRRMEIAECRMWLSLLIETVKHVLTLTSQDLNIPITMIRGRGSFQKSSYPPFHVSPADEGAVLEEKWQLWCRRESWKRSAILP